MFTIKRYLFLIEELTTVNDYQLFLLMTNNSIEYKKLISDQTFPETYSDFQQQIKNWFNNGRIMQFLIFDLEKKPIGTVFFYNLNRKNKNAFCSIFFIPKYRRSLIITEAIALILDLIRKQLHIDSLYFAVYAENVYMLNLAKKIKAHLIEEKISSVNQLRTIFNYSIKFEEIIFLNHFKV